MSSLHIATLRAGSHKKDLSDGPALGDREFEAEHMRPRSLQLQMVKIHWPVENHNPQGGRWEASGHSCLLAALACSSLS